MSTSTCDIALGVTAEGFAAAIDGLDEALAERLIGRESAWAEQVGAALAEMTTALRGHIATAQLGSERNRSKSRSGDPHERHDHFKLLEQTCVLQRQLSNVKQAFSSPPYTAFDEILEGGEQLVRALRQHQEKTPASAK
jgi:hypothetical protein